MRRGLTIAAVAVLVSAVVVGRAYARDFEVARLLADLRSLGSARAALWAFSGLYVLATSALLPSAVLHVVSGAMWGFWQGLWPNLVLANLTGHLHFAIGRWLGQARMRELLVRRGWTAALSELEQSGVLTVLVLRQTPIPFMATNLVCGASPITWRQFLLGHFIGLLPMVLVTTWFAAALAAGVEGAQHEAFVRVAAAAASMVVVALGTRLVMGAVRRRRSANEQRHG